MNFSITLLLCLVNYFFNFLKYIFKLNITSYKFIIYLIIYFYKFKIINYLFMMSLIRNKKINYHSPFLFFDWSSF